MNNIINNSLEYFDKQQDILVNNINKIIKKNIYKKHHSSGYFDIIEILLNKYNYYFNIYEDKSNIINEYLIKVYNDEKTIFKSNFYFLGTLKDNKIWNWIWSIDKNKDHTHKIQQLLNYALNLDIKNDLDVIVRGLLINNKNIINYDHELIMILSLALYLTNSQYIIKLPMPNNNEENFDMYYLLYNCEFL